MRRELSHLLLLYPPRSPRVIVNFSSTTLTASSKAFNAYAETCASHLKECSSRKSLSGGLAIHGHMIKTGVYSHRSLSAELLTMYSNCGRLTDCNKVFEELGSFNLFSWNFMISALVRCGDLDKACLLFDAMPIRNDISWTMMIDGHMKCGRIHDSVDYLKRNPYRTVVSWTAAINGLTQNGLNPEALTLLCRMLESGVAPNEITFTSVIRACVAECNFDFGQSVVGLIIKTGFERYISVCNSLITLHLRMHDLDRARRIFDQMEERDTVSWTTILDVYFEIGELKEARRLFDEMPTRNEVSWSTMIARYSQNGEALEALRMFDRMTLERFKPNISCFASVLSASAGLKNLLFGTNIHGQVLKVGFEEDVYISSALIDMYCKCGKSQDGRQVFDLIPFRNIVCWNSMVAGYINVGEFKEGDQLFNQIPMKNTVSWNAVISGYVESKNYEEVWNIFHDMLRSREMPNQTTFSSVLRACASLSLLEKGKNLHGKILKLGIQDEVFMGTALTDMYAKSGDIESSKRVFCQMPEKNEISWTAIIQGLADNGLAEESLLFFKEMAKTGRVPTEATFLSVLFACSHCGFVDQGFQCFESMRKVYGITPTEKHYTCMVDLLARGGHLREAEKFISKMPLKPEANSWAALLSACNTYRNDVIGERAAKKLWELEKENLSGHVLLSNIYASARRWDDVLKVRTLMREAGLKKCAGCSWIQVRDQFHKFFSWDLCHQKSLKIYKILELLTLEIMA